MRILTALVLTLTVAATASAQERRAEIPLISVVGNGEARVAPDMATVRIGVSARESTGAKAQETANAIAQKLLSGLAELGIPRKDIQTSQLMLYPQSESSGGQPPRVVGFLAQNIVSVRVENLALVGKVIDATVAVGGNMLQGVEFGLRNETPSRLKALANAVGQAKQKANAIADALGVRLLRVQDAEEGGARVVPPLYEARAMAGAATATPVEPGEISITATVTLRYAIAEGK
jgi:uncharacterized protein YggE